VTTEFSRESFTLFREKGNREQKGVKETNPYPYYFNGYHAVCGPNFKFICVMAEDTVTTNNDSSGWVGLNPDDSLLESLSLSVDLNVAAAVPGPTSVLPPSVGSAARSLAEGDSPSKLRILRPTAPPVTGVSAHGLIDPLISAGTITLATHLSAERETVATDADLLGTSSVGETITAVAWRAAVGEEQSTRLFLRVLNSDEPALNQHIADHIITDDAHLVALLDFVTRPISRYTHAGAAWIGQFAVDVAGLRGSVSLPSSINDVDAAAPSIQAAAHLRGDVDAAGSLEQRFTSFSILHEMPHPPAVAPASFSDSAVSSTSHDVIDARAPSLHEEEVSTLMYCSEGETDSITSSIAGPSPGGNYAHAIPGAVIAAHAASFSAAVADVRYSASAAVRSLLVRSSSSEDSSSGAFEISSNEAGPVAMALRPVSLLFPRQGEEVASLVELQNAPAGEAGIAQMTQQFSALKVQSPSSKHSTDQTSGTKQGASPSSWSRSPTKRSGASEDLRAPTPAELSRAIALENAAVKRSFRAMRLLCANNEIADDILESHTADVVKHLFGAFSARCKGSLYHVCAVLQRLIQVRVVFSLRSF
jgi:hypothetical protein